MDKKADQFSGGLKKRNRGGVKMGKQNDIPTKPNENDGEMDDGRSHDMDSRVFHAELESVENELMDFINRKRQVAPLKQEGH